MMNEELKSIRDEKRIYSIDLAKFICSILIVMLHTELFEEYPLLGNGIEDYLTRLAVPFFFVASGFLLFRKTSYDSPDMERIFRYVLRLSRLYLIWSVIYFYPKAADIMKSGNGLFQGAFVYLRHFLFVGSYVHLWYLSALIFAVVLIAVLIRRKCPVKAIMMAAGTLYFLGLFAQSWFGLIAPLRELLPGFWAVLKMLQRVFMTTRNGLCDGFLFVGLGMVFAFNNIKISREKSFLGFAISMCALLAEVVFVKVHGLAREEDMYFFLVPAAFFLFDIVVNTELKERKIYPTLKILGELTYFIHMWILDLVLRCLNLLGWSTVSTILLFAVVALLSVMVSYIILRLSKTRSFRWLRYLYS